MATDARSAGQQERRRRERMRAALGLPAIKDFESGLQIHPELAIDLANATREAEELLEAIGGEDASPQRRALVSSYAKVRCLETSLFRLFCRTGDPELAGRIATQTKAKSSLLAQLGLERFEREIDLSRGVDVEFSAVPLPEAPGEGSLPSSSPGVSNSSGDA